MSYPARTNGQLAINRQALAPYLDAGYALIPLHPFTATRTKRGKVRKLGKTPRDFNWPKVAYESAAIVRECIASNCNVGVRLRADQLVLDVDPRNGGDVSFKKLCATIGLDPCLYPTVNTGGGGQHLHMTKPAGLVIVGTHPDYPGVEFKSVGCQVVAASSIHPDTLRHYEWDPFIDVRLAEAPEAPAALLELVERPERNGEQHGGGEWDVETFERYLAGLDVEDFRDEADWRKVMMGGKHVTNGGGRDVFITWSTSDPVYADDEDWIGRRWDSCRRSDGPVITKGTLLKLYRETTGKPFQWHNEAERREDLEAFAEEEADTIGDEFEGLEAAKARDAAKAKPKPTLPNINEWVWIVDSMQFVHDDGIRMYNDKQFNSRYAYLRPDSNLLTDIWKEKLGIRKFDSQVYVPKAPKIVTLEGKECFNLWRPSAMKPKASDVQWFLDHVAYVIPNEAERELVLDYMALLIQRPEVKIHFALLIQSLEGVGKGVLGVILKRIIGERNVCEPSNSEVTGIYTGWQERAQLVIINELMAIGRLDIMNALKSPITDPTLRIHKKFGNQYTIPNHMNLICFTNHKDALPISASDRRWLVIFSPAKPKADSYYDRLFTTIRDDANIAAVMACLMERTITLNPKGRAPATAAKTEMRTYSMTDLQTFLADRLEARAEPFRRELVRLEDIVAAVPQEITRGQKRLHGAVLTFLDQEAKAQKHTRYVKGDLPAYQLWSLAKHDAWREKTARARVEAYEAWRAEDLDAALSDMEGTRGAG